MSDFCLDKCESEKDIHDLVKFLDVLIIYDLSRDIVVEFLADPSVKGSSHDWIGIYEAGWTDLGSFLAFVSVFGVRSDDTGRRRRVKFSPKSLCIGAKEQTHYQFVYIDKELKILGVSQYFQLKLRGHCETSFNEESFVCRSSSSPLKKTNTEDKQLQVSIGTDNNSSNCKLFSPTKWKNLCSSCYHCEGIFKLKASQSDLLLKVREYEELNDNLLERVNHLEKSLELERSKEESSFKTYIWNVSQAVLNHEQTKSALASGCFDWEFSRRELHLKAVVGHQELTIQELKRVICKLSFLENPISIQIPAKTLEDTVQKCTTEERAVPELFDINNNTSEEE